MGAVNPTAEQFRQVKKSEKQGPFVMVNLLSFSERGKIEGETGKATYERYMQAVDPLLKKAGGCLLWLGRVDQVFIGEEHEGFDHVMLVEYPSRKAFLDMVSSEEYLKANADREAGLKHTVLMVADPIYSILRRA